MTRYYMHHSTGAVYTARDLEVEYQAERVHHEDEENWCPKRQLKEDLAEGIWIEVEPKIKDADESNPKHWRSIGTIKASPQ